MNEVLFDFDTVARKPKIISEYMEQIREHFSIEDKALVFLRRRTGRNMPVRKYAISNKGYFELPFFDEICSETKIKFPSLQLKITPKLAEKISINKIADQHVSLNLTPRDYQTESANEALQKGKGIIVLPTSAGKTLVIALIASTILKEKDYNILVLVPDIQLVQQTYQDFLDYGIPKDLVSKWTGNYEFSPTKIVVANNQILLSKKQNTDILERFQTIICDECLRENTLISTCNGQIPIQKIKRGDLVYSYCNETQQIELQPVVNTWQNLPTSNSYDYFLNIEFEDGAVLQVTPNHKIYTKRGVIRADELTREDIVLYRKTQLMTFWYKYVYAKKTIQTYLSNLWKK